MSVIGSLEDLSFPDILQIIHLSRQTGTLVLSSPEGERRVQFQNGLVRGATLGQGGIELEDLLVQKGLVAPACLEPARARRTSDHKSQRNQEKEPYTTPELVVQEPLLDITTMPNHLKGTGYIG